MIPLPFPTPPPPLLRPYQDQALAAVQAAHDEGHAAALIVLATGAGKTLVFSELIHRWDVPTLILAHREELLTQARDKLRSMWPQADIGLIGAGYDEPRHRVTIASVASIVQARRLTKLKIQGIGLVVVDEAHHCHVPGTMITTSNGHKPIEDIQKGDCVYGWNGERFGRYSVTSKFGYWYDGPIYDIITESGCRVQVTPNHKLYADGRHVYASEIQPGNTVSLPAMFPDLSQSRSCATASSMASSWHETLPPMFYSDARNGDDSSSGVPQARATCVSAMRQTLSLVRDVGTHQLCAWSQSFGFAGSACCCHAEAQSEFGISGCTLSPNEKAQPDERSCCQEKDDASYTPIAERWYAYALWQSSLWQWRRANAERGIYAGSLSPCSISIGSHIGRWRETTPLQARYSMARDPLGCGDRWDFACDECQENGRSSQGCASISDRMGSDSSQQSRCSLREDRVVAVRTWNYAGLVHDFEVDTVHNYIANGVLSSNSAAPTYRKIITALGAGRDGGPFLLGVTATPQRADGKSLAPIYGQPVFTAGLADMVRAGYLVDLHGLQIRTGTQLDEVSIGKDGDFVDEELATAVNSPARNRLIVDAHQKHAGDRPTIVFAASVQHAHGLAELFRARGMTAAALDGETPRDERHRMLADFAAGRIQVLVNMMVLTEGFDSPEVSCLILARPTQSRSLYIQQVGRGARPAPGKQDCLIIDMVDNTVWHSLSLMSLPKMAGRMGYETSETPQFVADAPETEKPPKPPFSLRDTLDADLPARPVIERNVALLNDAFTWERLGNGNYRLRVATEAHRVTLLLELRDDGYVAKIGWNPQSIQTLTPTPMSLDWAQTVAEDAALQVVRGQTHLVDRNAPWRQRPATDKQVETLKKLKVKIPRGGITRGDASDMLATAFAQQGKKATA